MTSCKILNVCFKTKKLVGTTPAYQKYTWTCFSCGDSFDHDSRKKDNAKGIGIDFGGKEYRICSGCIKEMYNVMEEK